jgi:uncharacterized membrane protein
MNITLTHRELKELLNIVEEMNPPDTMMIAAGTVSITVDNSSGIGSILKATVPVKQGDRWGEWTTTISDESSWWDWMETKKRTLVKTVIYRIWVIATTYVMLLITGKSLDEALIPTIIINCVWMTSYYLYDRLWNRIDWGRNDAI